MSKSKEVIGKLKTLGWESLDAWSKAHGYERINVHKTVNRWFGRTEKSPHGAVAICIMHSLNETFTKKMTPEKFKEEVDGYCDTSLLLIGA